MLNTIVGKLYLFHFDRESGYHFDHILQKWHVYFPFVLIGGQASFQPYLQIQSVFYVIKTVQMMSLHIKWLVSLTAGEVMIF